jgi:hypothetical protein
VLQDFLRKYPGGPHAADATRQIEQIDWDNTDKRNASSLGAFLARHPSGDFAGQARNELDRMEREAARAAQARQATERMNADREALIRVLSAYSAAYERKDAGQVAALWPSLSQKQRRELEQAFRTFRSVRMELAPVGPAEISGDTARVRCDRSADAVDREGSHPQKDQVTVTFRRVGGRWLIDGIGKAGL